MGHRAGRACAQVTGLLSEFVHLKIQADGGTTPAGQARRRAVEISNKVQGGLNLCLPIRPQAYQFDGCMVITKLYLHKCDNFG